MTKDEIIKIEQAVLTEYLDDIKSFMTGDEADLNKLYQQYLEDLKEVATGGGLDDRKEMLGIAQKAMMRRGYIKRQEYLAKLQKILHSPYFARIDVRLEDEKNPKSYYVGKIGFPGFKAKKEITDWRSPVASLYYNHPFATKNVSFHVSAYNALDVEKKLACDLEVRRTIEIEHEKLINIYDDNLLDNIQGVDQFLISKLESKSGGGLEDIIETIQKDQNEIIRHNPSMNLVVQGVAGSGKTTIAIHRISYLFYNFPNKITPAETLFLSTSKVLVNYLAKSLPELDIYNIKRASVSEFVKEILDKNKIKVKTKIFTYLPQGEVQDYFSNDSLFLVKLDQYISQFEKQLRTEFEDNVVNALDVNFYNLKQILERKGDKPLLSVLIEALEDLKEMQKEIKKEMRYPETSFNLDVEMRKLQRIEDLLLALGKFLKQIKPEEIYFNFLQEEYKMVPKTFDTNHICALYYLTFNLGLITDLTNYSLVVIDEAQDLNILNYRCVRTFSSKNCFNLYGDLNQSIFKRSALQKWEDLEPLFSPEKSKKFELNISYRSTQEIIEFANNILIKSGIKRNLPIPVSRKGPLPVEMAFKSKAELLEELVISIKKVRGSESKSIGIIQTDGFELNEIKESLLSGGIRADIISEYFDNFKKDGIYIVPVRFVKGLEFDSVYVLNFESEEFKDEIEGHFKKFVCATRAMNNLFVYSL